mmetsp:Transcript_14463/g.56867  ORF Transcript_14463/g.56867 Transcript_14463/m.56867 type:complete len:401 (+) Transcript_14463:127-1329(+)
MEKEQAEQEQDARELLFSDDSDTEFFGAELARRRSDPSTATVEEPIRRAHQSVTITLAVLLALVVVWATAMALGVCYAYFEQFEDDLEPSAARWSTLSTAVLIVLIVALSLLPLPAMVYFAQVQARADVSLRWVALNFVVSYIINASVALFAYFFLFFLVFRWVQTTGYGWDVAAGVLGVFLVVTCFTSAVVTAFQYMLLQVLNRGATPRAVLLHAFTTGLGLASSQSMFSLSVGAFSMAVKLSRRLSDSGGASEEKPVAALLLPLIISVLVGVAEVIVLNLTTGLWVGFGTLREHGTDAAALLSDDEEEEEARQESPAADFVRGLRATLPSGAFRLAMLLTTAVPVCLSVGLEQWLLGGWWHVLWLVTVPLGLVLLGAAATVRMLVLHMKQRRHEYDSF